MADPEPVVQVEPEFKGLRGANCYERIRYVIDGKEHGLDELEFNVKRGVRPDPGTHAALMMNGSSRVKYIIAGKEVIDPDGKIFRTVIVPLLTTRGLEALF